MNTTSWLDYAFYLVYVPGPSGACRGREHLDRDQERAIEVEVQRVLNLYYRYTDQNELAKAADLYTADATWYMDDKELNGRDNILAAMEGSMSVGTVRHIQTNTVVDVIDENHAVARWYATIYGTHDVGTASSDGPLPLGAPDKLSNFRAELVRTPEGWRCARRGSQVIFQS